MSSMVADCPRLSMPICYNKESLVNILSLIVVSKLYRVTMDTAEEAVMHVHAATNKIMTVVEIPNELYCHDTDLPNYCTHKLK